MKKFASIVVPACCLLAVSCATSGDGYQYQPGSRSRAQSTQAAVDQFVRSTKAAASTGMQHLQRGSALQGEKRWAEAGDEYSRGLGVLKAHEAAFGEIYRRQDTVAFVSPTLYVQALLSQRRGLVNLIRNQPQASTGDLQNVVRIHERLDQPLAKAGGSGTDETTKFLRSIRQSLTEVAGVSHGLLAIVHAAASQDDQAARHLAQANALLGAGHPMRDLLAKGAHSTSAREFAASDASATPEIAVVIDSE